MLISLNDIGTESSISSLPFFKEGININHIVPSNSPAALDPEKVVVIEKYYKNKDAGFYVVINSYHVTTFLNNL